MLPPFLPPLITPAPFMFDSEEAYERAMKSFRVERARRERADAWNLAVVIVAATIMAGLGVFAIGLVAYAAGGWRGVAYLVVSCGLLWVAVVRVHDYLVRGRRT